MKGKIYFFETEGVGQRRQHVFRDIDRFWTILVDFAVSRLEDGPLLRLGRTQIGKAAQGGFSKIDFGARYGSYGKCLYFKESRPNNHQESV